MPALYEIAAEHRAAMHQMADMADLPDEVITDTLAGIDGEFDAKAISVAAVIQNLNAEALAMKEAEARMAARRRATENRAKHLKEYLLSNMIFMKHTRIKCPEFVINIKNRSKYHMYTKSFCFFCSNFSLKIRIMTIACCCYSHIRWK